jgi:hypothetical protein
MSTRDFTANVISATKVVPDGNFKDSKASGVWDINEALDLIKGGNWPNAANINPAAFVDALFQCHIYTGNGGTQTITNNIDLSGSGGLVWIKKRLAADNHALFDTERGVNKDLESNDTDASNNLNGSVTAFNSNGFSLGDSTTVNNGDGGIYSSFVSWTFRKQPKFFDVVTYTGTSSAQAISHNLGSVPGMIMVKCTNDTGNWRVYHRGLDGGNAPEDYVINLNLTNAEADSSSFWNDTAPTSTHFTVGGDDDVNDFGDTYVAYLFAHNNNDGGFGEPGDQDIIKCGSVTLDGSGQGLVDLGFEPSWIIYKRTDGTGNWIINDNIRGWTAMPNQAGAMMLANSNLAEGSYSPASYLNSSGFLISGSSGQTFIYTAIRRGGMQTPTAASDVFDVDTSTQAINSSNAPPRTPFPVDMGIYKARNASGTAWPIFARLQGANYLQTQAADAEGSGYTTWDQMDGWGISTGSWESSADYVFYNWKRAPSYFDVVAYIGNDTAGRTVSHNLGAVPEMMWVKRRNSTGGDWDVYHKDIGNTKYLTLNSTAAASTSQYTWHNTTPTESVFTIATGANNTNGDYFIAYLFATLAGVSKVGSYTGNAGASTINVDCGFTGDTPSFILIKETSGTGNWWVFDSVRGIVAGTEKALYLNTTDAETSAYDYIDPYSGGFSLSTNSGINTDGATFIFYAIAAIS